MALTVNDIDHNVFNVIMLNVVNYFNIMLSVINYYNIMLSVFMLNVIMLSVVAPVFAPVAPLHK